MRPAAVGAGATGSFLTVAARFVAAAGAFAAVVVLRAGAAFFAPGFVTMVVPALVELPSLSLPLGAADSAVPGRLVCLLGAREDGFCEAGFTGLDDLAAIDDVFSAKADLMGDRGKARWL